MNIYDMMKSGMSQEAIFTLFKEECATARAALAKEEAEAKAAEEQAKKEALMAEGRAHVINAVCAYSEALGEPMDESDVTTLESKLKEFESEMLSMWSLLKDLETLGKSTSAKSAAKASPKIPMSGDALQKTIQDLLKGMI